MDSEDALFLGLVASVPMLIWSGIVSHWICFPLALLAALAALGFYQTRK